MDDQRWLYCLDECEWMAAWIGPHRHRIRSDGRVGIILERLSPEDLAVVRDDARAEKETKLAL